MIEDDAPETPITDGAGAASADPSPHESDHEQAPEAPTAKKKPAARRQRGAGKKTTDRKSASRKAAVTAQQAKFPRHSVEKSLRVAKAIFDQNAGKPTSTADAAKYTTGGKPGGPFTVEVSSGKKYGFLKSDGGKLVPQDRA